VATHEELAEPALLALLAPALVVTQIVLASTR